MKLQIVAPRRGLDWVRRAFQVFVRQPLGFASLFAACLFVFLLLGLIPVVGTVALLVLPPTGSLLFMIASRLCATGTGPMPAALIELARAGRPRLVALLKLGIVYAAATFFVFWLAGVFDGGALDAFFDTLPDAKTTPESAAARVGDPRLQLGLLLRLVFAGALSVPFWHAPALIELARAGRPRLVALLKLGIVYAAATFFVFWLAGVFDGGALEAFFDTLPDAKTTPESAAARVGDPRLQLGLLLRLVFAGARSVPFWHAPALIYWGGQSWAKSLFFSTVALWRNKGAFFVYGLAWMALWLLLLAIVSLGVGLFGAQRFTLVATPLTLVFSTIFYASLWFTFADCFAPVAPDATDVAPSGDPDPDPSTKGSP